MWAKIYRWLLKAAGAAPAEELAMASSELTTLRARLNTLKAELKTAHAAALKAGSQLDAAQWTNPYLVELNRPGFRGGSTL